MPATTEPARVYTVSGGGAASSGAAGTSFNSSSLPDLLRKSGSSNKRKKRKTALKDEEILNRIELIQDFEFPEASNRITPTRDGQSILATGTYKPQLRVWDCEQLSLKFERHTDAENVDLLMLSDDWTKSLHLQSDRTVELQGQGGAQARVRIPRFGRALGYHFPSADAIVGAAGREVYRLNLDQGRFLAPFVLGGGDLGEPTGCNAVDVNPAHGLLCFGTEGTGVVEMWDPRMRKRAGALSVATETVLDAALMVARRNLPGVFEDVTDGSAASEALASLSVTALAGAEDGLNLAVGTNTGHVLLYDLRMDRPYQTKDQGFGLPIKKVLWPGDKSASSKGGGGPRTRTEAEGKVLSSDAKVIKVWDKNSGDNLVSVTPPSAATDINDVCHYPGTGLLMAAVEGTQMAAWYVPALGPAPKWCSYIDTLTDEMDGVDSSGGAGSGKGVYEDFKFVDRPELERLGMSHLVGTQLLRPYMHGYFISLPLYERARLLSNPTAYADARDRAIKAKLEKQAESRIRAVKNAQTPGASVRVNKELAAKVVRDAEKAEQKQAKRDAAKAASAGQPVELDQEIEEEAGEADRDATLANKLGKTDLLSDPRFGQLFQDPEYQIDTTSREFAMLNPSTAVNAARDGPRKLTAVEDEENDDSDRESIDPDMEDESESDDSDEDLGQYDPRARDASGNRPKNLNQAPDSARGRGRKASGPRLVDDDDDDDDRGATGGAKKKSFEQRLRSSSNPSTSGKTNRRPKATDFMQDGEEASGPGGKEFTWTPSASSSRRRDAAAEDVEDRSSTKKGSKSRAKDGDENFGFGLSKGAGADEGKGVEGLSEEARFGRQKRRHPNRSASKNIIMRRN